LSKHAIADGRTLLFPGVGEGAMSRLVRKMGYSGRMSPHGARSSFSTWVSEATTFEPALAEIALGHKIGSAVAQRYMRGDMLDKRRRLMIAWSEFITGSAQQSGAVVPMRR
jgi:integrase